MFNFREKMNAKPQVCVPSISEKWIIKTDKNDPFPARKRRPVTILDVKDDWVRYSFDACSKISDERMEVELFTSIYEKTNNSQQGNNEGT